MNLIVAADRNWGIGKNGSMPWHIKADLQYFKKKTFGKTVIMGRKTLESLPGGRPLSGRENIVLTRSKDFFTEGVSALNCIEEINKYKDDCDVFVIGGGSLYHALLSCCKYAYVTKIDASYDCDTYFPNLDELDNWSLEDAGQAQTENGITFRFTVYKNNLPVQNSETEEQ